MNNRTLDLAMSVFLLLFGSWVVVVAFGLGIWSPIGPASGFFPLAAGLLIALLSLVNIGRAAMGKATLTEQTSWTEFVPIIGIILLIGLYLLSVPFLGMFAPLPVFLVLLSLSIGWRTESGWLLRITGGAFVFSILTYFVFKEFLGMLIPKGPFGF